MKKSIFPVLLALLYLCGCQKPEKQFVETQAEIPPVVPQETPAPDATPAEKQEIPTQTLQLHWPQLCNYTMDMSIEVPETWSMLSRASIWDEQERYTCGSNGVRTVLEKNQSLSALHDLDPDSTLLSSEIVTINGKEYLLEINDVWNSEDISDPKTACGQNIYYNYYFLQDDHVVHFFFVHYENSGDRLALYEQILSSMQVEISNSYVKYDPLVNALDYAGILDHEFTVDNITDMTQWDWYYIFHALNDSRPIIGEDGFRYWPAEEVESVLCTALSAEPSVIRNSTEFYDKERNIYMEPTGLGGAGPIGVITSAEKDNNTVTLNIDLYSADSTMKMHSCVLTAEMTDKGWKLNSNEILTPDITFRRETFTFTTDAGEHTVTLEVPDTWVFENHAFHHVDNPDFEVAFFPGIAELLTAGQSLITYQDKMLLLNRDHPINYNYFTLDGRDFNIETYMNSSKFIDSPHQYLHCCYFVENGYIYNIQFCDRGEIWDELTTYKYILSSIQIQ